MSFWAYMLHCRGGCFYVGHTDDIDKRIGEHKSGLIPGFTADQQPVELVWSDQFANRDDAKAAERMLKGWSRAKKLALIRSDWERISALAKKKDSASTSAAWTGKGEGGTEEGEVTPPKPVRPELVEGSLFSLQPHPETPCQAIDTVTVEVSMQGPDWVSLSFRVSGRVDLIKFPVDGHGVRVDGLWAHTCFEMFSRNKEYEAYEELNFSPSTDWAHYAFLAYRNDMRNDQPALAPNISVVHHASEFCLSAQAALAEGGGPWQIALSAVIEELDGTKSYWALAHSPGKPDFHHPACFAATLPPPSKP